MEQYKKKKKTIKTSICLLLVYKVSIEIVHWEGSVLRKAIEQTYLIYSQMFFFSLFCYIFS